MLAATVLLIAWPAVAHVMSMSSGDLVIDGSHARYELHMPLYEISHVSQPEDTLLAHVRFGNGRLTSKACKVDEPAGSYICTAEYSFPAPVDRLEVECTLASVTVPNHVHLLHATLGGKRQEAVFDLAFTRTSLRFKDASAAEEAVTQATAGLLRALGGPVQLLFLAALVLAARGRRELATLAVAFFAGQCLSVLLVPLTRWEPPPRFVEAAAALTIAYLAVEILLLPKAGARGIIAGALGCFHGLWLLLFIQSTRYHAPLVLLGAGIGEGTALGALAWGASRIALPRFSRGAASALLVLGLAWFWMGLRG